MRAEPRQDLGSAPGSETPTPLMPYHFTIDWCAAVEDQEHAVNFFDAVTDAVENTGGFPQGGLVQKMDASDVVPDSPLAAALTRSESPSGAVATPKSEVGDES